MVSTSALSLHPAMTCLPTVTEMRRPSVDGWPWPSRPLGSLSYSSTLIYLFLDLHIRLWGQTMSSVRDVCSLRDYGSAG